MHDHGFDGCYKQKTRESMGAAGKMDGCAMFWRRSKFRLAERFDVEFNNHARALVEQIAESKEHERTLLKRLLKDNIGMVAVLEVLLPSSSRSRGQEPMHVCVANTHLYSNKDFPDVKLWQCHVLLRELEYKCRDLPLVLCGDFNSIPSSAVYDLLAMTYVRRDHPDLAVDTLGVLPPAHDLSHGLNTISAYAAVTGGEPPYTNVTAGFTGVLDYIWCSADTVRPLAVTAVPDKAALAAVGGTMPNAQYSSDHILMCADVQVGGSMASKSY